MPEELVITSKISENLTRRGIAFQYATACGGSITNDGHGDGTVFRPTSRTEETYTEDYLDDLVEKYEEQQS